MENKTILVALGGNALQKGKDTSGEAQEAAARLTAKQLVTLVGAGHELVIVHGNGPQVGDIVLHEEALNSDQSPTMPLDICVAMSQGEIGYWLQQALYNEFAAQGVHKSVATVATQTIVDEQDPGFQDPSKPIGMFYPDQQSAEAAAQKRGFVVKEDAGRGWRRVVPSPRPLDIVEKEFINCALAAGNVVIAAGGGGVPVIRRGDELVGIEAVVDKDLAAEKLAELIGINTLIILTAVDAVTINFRQPNETPLRAVTAAELERYIAEDQFAPGSMLPKIQAVLAFVRARPGNRAIITSPAKVLVALNGNEGTHITA